MANTFDMETYDIVSILIFNGHESRRFSIYFPRKKDSNNVATTSRHKLAVLRA